MTRTLKNRAVPFHGDDTGRFLPWLIAVMIFLFVLSLTATLVINKSIGAWHSNLTGMVTVQLIPLPKESDADLGKRIKTVEDFLKSHHAVETVTTMTDDHSAALLKPWLGDDLVALDLPLPKLIDVRLKAGSKIDAQTWNKDLSAKVEGASIDSHNTWLMGLIQFAKSLKMAAMLVLLTVGLASIIIVIYTTRTGLAVHAEVIDILHLIGARDRYIAWQFQVHAAYLTFKGSLIGTAVGLITVLAVSLTGQRVDSILFPNTSLSLSEWLLLALLPLAMVAMAMFTARTAVMRSLKQMV